MSEKESPLEIVSTQDKTHKKFREHSGKYSDRVYLLQYQCHLQEERHPIYKYEYLGEEERKCRGVNDYKLIETSSNVSTWRSLLEFRSKVSTWVIF